ncbi:MAG: vitamin K epoxide reductase family protein [Verrucomicrobia bacterium]|nr:vitamin K epoxide reductase family protein [Verrucomicrobiota bacterium]
MLGAAVLAAVYLGVAAHRQAALPGCQSGCDEVLGSRWSHVGGVPVSWPGALVYAALLALSGGFARFRVGGGVWAALALSWLVPLAALWFVAVQALLLGAFCPWCCGCHLAASLGVAALWLARAQAGGSAGGFRAWAREARLPVVGAAGLVVVLGLSQGLLTPLEPAATRELGLPPAVDRVTGASGGRRVVSIYGEQVRAGELPLLGRLEAPHLALGLFDYTCHHCRRLHLTLESLVTSPAGRASPRLSCRPPATSRGATSTGCCSRFGAPIRPRTGAWWKASYTAGLPPCRRRFRRRRLRRSGRRGWRPPDKPTDRGSRSN